MLGTPQPRRRFLANIPAPARTAVLGLLIASLSPAALGEFGAVFGPEKFIQDSSKAVDFTSNFTLQDLAPTYILRIDNIGTLGTPPVSDGSITLNGVEVVGSKDFIGDSKEPVILIQRVIHPVGNNQLVVHLDSHQPSALTIQITGVYTFRVFGPEDFIRNTGTAMEVTRTFTVPNPNAIWFVRITNGGLRGQFGEVSSAVITLNGTEVAQQNDFSKGQGCQTSECAPLIEKFVTLLAMNDLEVDLTSDPGNGLTVEILGIDNDAPVISGSAAPPPNPNGWNNSDVTVTFTCSDTLSGIAFCTPPVQVTAEGANQAISGIARDNAGNVASASVNVSIDNTPPIILAAITPPPNSAGWNDSNATVTFTCSDSISGIDFCPGPVLISAEGASQATLGTARDRAGNTATTSKVINVDKAPPTLTITSPLSGAVVPVSPLTVTGDVSDVLSGVASVSCQGSSAALSGSTFSCIVPILAGSNSINVQATDVAGNIRQVSVAVQGGVPTILSLTPNAGQQGQTNISVTVTGQFTNFVQGKSQINFGAGITVVTVTAATATSLIAEMTIAANATLGPRTITVTTGTEVATLPGGFSVVAGNQPPAVSAGPNQIISLQSASVVFTEYPIPTAASLPNGVTAGPDGNLWFTESLGNKIGRITATGAITEFSVPTNGGTPLEITAGPDGNLWFTEEVANKIGRITPAGVITEYSIPTSDGYPQFITTGPDGNLWFAEGHGNKIGSITPAGFITEFSVPTTGSGPSGIGVGPDGNLWFTEWLGSKIGRITPAGLITEFSTPTANSRPLAITAGPDGNLWFTEEAGNNIGRITLAGVLSEFPVPSGSAPHGITVGPDGNVWFAEILGYKIGRINGVGVITEFSTPTASSQPSVIVTGPDGNLWFTEYSGGKIGKANLELALATLNGSVTDDGLPDGTTLTTTWSETSGPGPVVFASPTMAFPDIAGQANSVMTSATFSTPGVYTLSLTGSDSQLSSGASVTVTVNPSPTPNILSVTPNAGQQGQQNLSINITGQFTHWVQGTTTASFGAGITVGGVTVASATSLTAQITVAANAALGPRTVAVTAGTEVVSLSNGFTVTLPAVNQPPIVSAGPSQTITLASAPVTMTEYPIPTTSSYPIGITTGPDGNLWFTEANGFKIGRITGDGAITEFPTGYAVAITAGPDGNLWFTEQLANKIGKITMTGVVTEFSIPTSGSYPSYIAVGPDGNLWFSELSASQIGRITPAGVITEFPAPSCPGPEQLTKAPDGNLWFAASGGSICKINATGVISEFPVPTAGSLPVGLTSGPDGNLWFTEQLGNKIGRITTTGVITEFPVPTAGGNPVGITTGPDGNLWFTEWGQENGSRVGRITSAGVITEFPIPTAGGAPFLIARGPDCNLWFTESIGNSIAKINPLFLPTTLTGGVTDDGLPAGTLLTTAWSLTSGACHVGFSNPTATFPDVAGQTNPVVTSATFSSPGTYILGLAGSDSQLSGNSSVTLTVNLPQGPTVVSVNPSSGQQGQQNLSVTIVGQSTNFVQGTSQVSFGAGVTVGSVSVADATHLTASVTIASNASVDARTVTVTTGPEVVSLSNGFTVQGVPTILSVNPIAGAQGQQSLSVNISGQFTHFAQGTTTANFDVGITVASLTVNSATSATALLNISPMATAGPRRITLTTGTEIATLGNAFTIQVNPNQPPQVSAGCDVTVFLPSTLVTFAEYPVATSNSGPTGITMGPDCNLWFTEQLGNNVGRITPSGVITEFPVPTAGGTTGSLTAITAGGDGNLWSADYFGNKIWRVTTNGVATGFSIPTGGSFPIGIIAGPDGNVWFTERLGNKIGRITPAGVITEFSVPTSGSQFRFGSSEPYGITVGTDGNLWFTEDAANQIGRITPAGVITEFLIPTAGSGCGPISGTCPQGITAGPDGNVWFIESGANKIGRITPLGVITEFSVPTAASSPSEITAAPDGNLWFTEDAASQIGRITPAGVITEFPIPSNGSRPNGITAGPDGNLWFAEGTGNKIGRANAGIFLTGKVMDDGLPAGAILSATWSETSGPSTVSFGNPTSTFPDIAGQQHAAVTLSTFSTPGTYTLTFTGSDSQLSSSSNVNVTVTPPPGAPAILSVNPNTGQQGQQNLSVTIAGQFTHLLQGTSQVSFGSGITVGPVTVINNMSLSAPLTIATNAALGLRTVTVTTGTEVASLSGGFTVVAAVNQPPVVSAGSNQIISLSPTPATITEYQIPTLSSNSAESITTGPDGSLWFTENDANKIGRITTGGAFTEFPIPALGNPQDIVAGPDGSLWFTQYSGSKIWKITPAGVFTPFQLSGGSFPYGITAGADGNLWFTERISNKIGRITTAGVITEFPVPTANSQPLEITVGSDGNLWFTELGAANGQFLPGNNIGRITTAGAITEFPIPTANSGPYGITAGPDGNLWFAEIFGNKIGRITSSGVITEFPVPTANSEPSGITTGPDGNLWFTEQSADAQPPLAKVARLTPAGVFTEFPLPVGSSRPLGITLGPDCNLWFTELFTNLIGKIIPGVVLPVTTTLTGSVTDDGLPLGAMLTATWSATSGPAPVSFGNPIATFPNIAGQPNSVITSATFCRVGPYILNLTGSDSLLSSSANVTISITVPGSQTILSVNPNTGQQSQQNLSVNITGQLTHFAQGTTTANFGAGITIASLTVNSATTATAVLSIDPSAPIGGRTVTLTTGTEVVSLLNGFTVLGAPQLTTVTPNVGPQGQQTVPVTIIGQFTHFIQGTTTASFGAGITVASLTVNSATSATAVLNIGLAAAVGPRTITVTTGGEVASLSGGFTVTAAVNQPPVVSAGSSQTITLSLAPTTMTEYLVPTAGTGPRDITVGSDGNLWFAEDGGQSIGRVTTAGNITEFSTSAGTGGTEGITNGPDGNIWFTEYTRQKVGRITPSGVITEFSLSLGSYPYGITSGPDGNLWFVGRLGNYIGRITPVGAITTFALPNANSNPVFITTGPDGNLWFTELGGANGVFFGPNSIGRITPSGVITEFPIPTINSAPQGITTGPDGNLWFTESSGNKIGRITTAGVITEFLVPTVGSAPVEITLGPDGNLWFTEDFGSKIGRITPSGVITEFSTPTASSRPQGITVGPDCQLWFAEGTGNKIAKMIPGVVVPVTTTLTGSLTDDGLPLASMLTATWNVVSGATPVSFGTPTATFSNIAGQTNPVTTSATFCRANPYVLSLTGSDSLLSSSSNVSVTINAPAIPTVPTIVSVNPNAGVQGQQNVSVTISGQLTNFFQGTSQVSFGPGITVTSVTVSDSSSLTAQFSIDPNATLGARTVTVTTGTESASQANAFTVTAPAAGPSITQVSPNAGRQGQGGPLGIVGLNTHFVQGITTLDLGPGITVSSVTATCDTCLTAQVVIAANAAVGPRTVTATTGSEVAQLANGFTVLAGTPMLTSMVPASGRQGQSVTSTVTGQFTNWVQGTTTVNLGAGITVNTVTVTNPTTMTVQLTVAANAALGLRNLTVTTGTEIDSATNVFNVLAGLPMVTLANPNTGQQGQSSLPVTITGQFTNFVQGTSQISFGAGIAVNSVTVASLTSLTANISIAANAATGLRTVTVTTGAEVASLANAFTVLSTTPVLVTVSPNTGQPGQSGPVTITGQSTNFMQGTSQVSFGAGISVGTVTVTSATSLTAQITVTANAAVGTRTVTVTSGTEIASLINGFIVQAGISILTFIDPASGQQGQSLPVALTGQFTTWVQGTTTVSLGADITVGTVTVSDSTHLTAQVSIAANAAVGSRTATVTTGTEIESSANAFDVVVAGPRLVSANPNSGQEGQANLSVAIVGLSTHFVQGTSQITFGSTAVVVNSITVADGTHLTANITIATNAAPVARTIVVTTGTEVATLPNGFTVTAGTNQPPVITISPTWSVTLPNRLVLTYTVTDDGLPFGGTLTTSWDTITTPAGATVGYLNQTLTSISAGFSDPGTYTLRITSTDTQFTVSQDVTVTVTGNPVPGPTVSLTSPTDGAEITAPVNVVGSVDSPNLASWTLEFKPIEETVFRTLATGTAPVTNGVLGTFDPTILLNGIVQIQLSATDTFGQTTTTSISVVLTKNQKIGNFTVSFNDLSVPVAGLPIQIIRTYDSRSRFLGDFGAGWTLDLKTVRLRKSIIEGDQWNATTTGGAFPTYCIQPAKPHVVSVTLPDGTEYTFDLTLTPQCQQLAPPDQVTFGFAPRPGTIASLSIIGNKLADVSASFPGTAQLVDLDDATLFDANEYRLTLPDGRVLDINLTTGGLEKMTDLNGNTLTVSSAGIVHSSGKSVLFTRDSVGRITQITDPAGNTLNYVYLGGDLFTFTDRENNTTTFGYDNNHGLLSIQDPRGIQPIKNVYDNAGRLIQHIDAFGNTINYTHSLNTHEEIVTDRLGNITDNQYDANGNVVMVTDAMGGVTTRTYDADGNVLTETNADGKTRTYTYDAQDNRLTETDPLGNKTTYTYNGNKQVLTITDPLSRLTTNTYDVSGNLLSTKDPLDNVTNYAYTAQGLRSSMTDALGNVTNYQYDSSGNLTQQTDPLGNVTTYTYDGNGNKLSETKTRMTTSGPETLITSYQYNKNNQLIQTTYPDGSTTQTAYNSIGKPATTSDQLGRVTSYTYDAMGRLTQTAFPDTTTESATYDAEGRRITSTDRGNRTTSYLNDPLGRLIKTTFPDGAFTTTIYDPVGQVTQTADARGNTTIYAYDDASRRTQVTDALSNVTNFQYDAAGNQTSVTDGRTNTTQYQYDSDNRRTRVIYPDTTTDQTGYDALGRTVSKTDQAGVVTQYQYDKLGQLTLVTDALHQPTGYTYDEVGNRIIQTDANSHTTTFAYDKLGRRTKRTLPLGVAETMTYDAAGNLKTKTDFNGKTTTYAYDSVNRLTSEAPDASLGEPTVSFTYTAAGQRASMVDASGTTNYIYDLRDRLLTKATPEGTLTYTYDLQGNLTTIRSSNAGGTSVDYAYDALNRLSTTKDNRITPGTTSYSYDAAGNLGGYQYPNGVQTSYTYNTLNRLGSMSIAKSGTLASFAYTIGASGNRTGVVELGGRQVNYTYDALYRLTNETIAGGAVNGTFGYTYDAVGNRLSRTSTVAPVPPTTSSYDANDRLVTDTYDNNGNTTISGSNFYGYDFENHLKTQTGGTAVAIVYDADGNRVAKTVSGVTTRYLVDDRNLTGNAQVLEEVTDTVQRVYTYGLHRISESQTSGTSFYGYDGHGNVRLLTDSTGAITDRYDYDAFGNVLTQAGTTPNVYLYSGEQNDANLGLYYLRARYMNPQYGRFLTQDSYPGTFTDPRSLHKYLYAHADPVNRHDPSGHLTLIDVSATLAVQAVLEDQELIYSRNLIKFGIAAARCTYCLINPGYKLQNVAYSLISDDEDARLGQQLYEEGQILISEGYREIGLGAAEFYENNAWDFVLDPLKTVKIASTVGFINDRIAFFIALRLDANVEKLRKVKGILEETDKLIDAWKDDKGGAACRTLWFLELANEFL